MPNVLPTIPNDPPQGIQALLDKVYLWNPDVSNELIGKINELLEKFGDVSGAIKPYSMLTAPVMQYVPCYYGSGVYVAARELNEIPMEFNEADWILIATKGVTAEEVAETYLPLSGGTLTGKVEMIANNAAFSIVLKKTSGGVSQSGGNLYALQDGLQIYAITADGALRGDYRFLSDGFSAGSDIPLGSSARPWAKVFTLALNNGADLAVPTEGGTLARTEDIDAAVGDISTALTAILGE